ncbi:hypothetical protein [Kibdelosporangium aridum]|uniref:hypothetical protein n=1 Tax=Kibdelosporangium aridum TaxID=2030 RepID=UPI00117A4684|nr:hypothetical protein [Kibdelosporangium aridum]
MIRELSRFDNDADLYRYPLALLTMPNGRTGVVHCPEDSGQLDIEDALHDVGTGDVLAEWPELATGEAKSSLVGDGWFSGPATIAVDPVNSRFAHTDGSAVTVIQLG